MKYCDKLPLALVNLVQFNKVSIVSVLCRNLGSKFQVPSHLGPVIAVTQFNISTTFLREVFLLRVHFRPVCQRYFANDSCE